MGDAWDREVRARLGHRPSRSAGCLASLEFDKRYRALLKESIIAGKAAAPVFTLPEEVPKTRKRKASSKPKATKAKAA